MGARHAPGRPWPSTTVRPRACNSPPETPGNAAPPSRPASTSAAPATHPSHCTWRPKRWASAWAAATTAPSAHSDAHPATSQAPSTEDGSIDRAAKHRLAASHSSSPWLRRRHQTVAHTRAATTSSPEGTKTRLIVPHTARKKRDRRAHRAAHAIQPQYWGVAGVRATSQQCLPARQTRAQLGRARADAQCGTVRCGRA